MKMMQIENLKALGFKDMHQTQIDSITEMIGFTLNVAAMAGDQEILDDAEAVCDAMVQLFGGRGVVVNIEPYWDV